MRSRRVDTGLPSRIGVPLVFAARTVSGAEAESKAGSRSETQAGADRAAEEASWMKRARLSRSESVSPMVVAFEELIKPNQGDFFK
jgi:hypothetical protein